MAHRAAWQLDFQFSFGSARESATPLRPTIYVFCSILLHNFRLIYNSAEFCPAPDGLMGCMCVMCFVSCAMCATVHMGCMHYMNGWFACVKQLHKKRQRNGWKSSQPTPGLTPNRRPLRSSTLHAAASAES